MKTLQSYQIRALERFVGYCAAVKAYWSNEKFKDEESKPVQINFDLNTETNLFRVYVRFFDEWEEIHFPLGTPGDLANELIWALAKYAEKQVTQDLI